ncbi:MAG TPA: hotdog fold thioesterase [Candidatus Lokiarchaeia archaeon]|nr:hotdog fold thioesterase [Candidatus Lokiarchaeia archaeon]
MNNLDIVKAQFKKDNFANKFRIVLDDLKENSIKMHMILDSSTLNLFGRPHGGAIYALADAAFSIIGNNNNNLSVALESSINYHASPDPGKNLIVEGKELCGSTKIGSYLFDIFTEEGGQRKSIATMMSTLYKTGKPIVEEQADEAEEQ